MTEAEPMVFVDANVLVYAYDQTAGEKREHARSLLEGLWSRQQGSLSVQVLQEFYVAVTQMVKRPLAPEVAADIVRDLAYWNIHAPVAEDILGAIDLQQRYGISFWDSMIVWSAQQMGCREVWTEDLSEGQSYGDVVVVNPFRG